MKKYFSKVFRYPAVDLYMLLGFFMAFISLFIGVSLFSQIESFNQDASQYQYQSSYSAHLQPDRPHADYWSSIADTLQPIYTKDVVFSVKVEHTEYPAACWVFLNDCSYEFPYTIGHWFDDSAENEVIIGKNYADSYGLFPGSSLWIDGEAYHVVGVIHSEKSSLYDNTLVLQYSHMGSHAKTSFLLQEKNLVVESQNDDARSIYDNLKAQLLQHDPELLFTNEGPKMVEKSAEDNVEGIIYIALYVVALLHCIIVGDLWGYERRYEMMVKKTMGFSGLQLLLDLFRQLSLLSIMAAISCFIIQWIFQSFGGSFLGISLDLSANTILMIIGFAAFSAAVCVTKPFLTIKSTRGIQLNGD